MITKCRHKVRCLVSASLRSCRPVSSRPQTTEPENPNSEESAVLQWLTSPHQTANPPPITTRLNFSFKSSSIHLQVNSTPIHLPQSQSLTVSINLLSNAHLLRRPTSLAPLTIEYSSPNIAKPLHMGHLRSTLTGSYVRNVAAYAGHACRSVCFLGDWGRQFGILHAGVLHQMDGNTTDFRTHVSSLDLHALLQIYVSSSNQCQDSPDFSNTALRLSAELDQNFDADSDGKFLWSHTKSVTVEHLQTCYDSLGIRFDAFEGESTYNRDSRHTSKALEMLEKHDLILRKPDGSVRVKTGDDSDAIILKRDDSSVYLLRDIACAIDRRARFAHNFVYVVDLAQVNHFKHLFQVLKSIGVSESSGSEGPFSGTHTHVPFGKVEGMSTRSGNFVLLSEVIDQGTELMHESRRKSKNARNLEDKVVSQRLAVSGLIVNALKVRRNRAYAFDWNEALKSNGNSGVALQYTLARVRSLVRRVTGGEEGVEQEGIDDKLEVLWGNGRQEVGELLVCLMNFEDVFWRSYTTLEPCILVAYAFQLADKMSKALSFLNVRNEKDKELAEALLWLFEKSRSTLEKCLGVLGVQPVGEF